MSASRDKTTPFAMRLSPLLILGRPVLPLELVQGLLGRIRTLTMWSRKCDRASSGMVGPKRER